MMECEAKAPDISHMDVLYDEIDDITLSQVWWKSDLLNCLINVITYALWILEGVGGAHAPSKSADISHMDVLYDEIDDITLSQVCQAMENEHTWLTRQGSGNILVAARLEYFHAPAL
jgi:hypothetical protein